MNPLQAYRESEAAAENPVHLVVLLYEQLARDIQRAIDAVAKHDIPARVRELDHALLVVGQLQGTINPDRGGEVAVTLDHFYEIVRSNLLLAATQESSDLLQKQRQQILAVHEAWLQVERQLSPPPAGARADVSAAGSANIEEFQEQSEWKA